MGPQDPLSCTVSPTPSRRGRRAHQEKGRRDVEETPGGVLGEDLVAVRF